MRLALERLSGALAPELVSVVQQLQPSVTPIVVAWALAV
jgi:hypothetical protein